MSKPMDPSKSTVFQPELYAELGKLALDDAIEGLERRRNDIENIKLLLLLPPCDPDRPSTITINGKPYEPHRNRS